MTTPVIAQTEKRLCLIEFGNWAPADVAPSDLAMLNWSLVRHEHNANRFASLSAAFSHEVVMVMEEVAFALENDGTGWPPAAVEWIYVLNLGKSYQVKTPPLFIKDMSVDDVIELSRDGDGRAISWFHISKSPRSTIWIMATGQKKIDGILQKLRSLGCNTESLSAYSYYAIDVPGDLDFSKVDQILECLDESVASVAFPSFRHNES